MTSQIFTSPYAQELNKQLQEYLTNNTDKKIEFLQYSSSATEYGESNSVLIIFS